MCPHGCKGRKTSKKPSSFSHLQVACRSQKSSINGLPG
jgi:hypothetical protein